MLAERDEEIAIEKRLAGEQAMKALADSEKVEAQLKDMEIKQKSTRQLTRREMMLEKTYWRGRLLHHRRLLFFVIVVCVCVFVFVCESSG